MAVAGEEPERLSVDVRVMPVAVLADRCATTGWEEVLHVAVEPELLTAPQLARELKDYLNGSGEWDAFCAAMAQEGIATDASALQEAMENIYLDPAL